jgi:hypothetical protein
MVNLHLINAKAPNEGIEPQRVEGAAHCYRRETERTTSDYTELDITKPGNWISSPFLKISQHFYGFKNLRYVGAYQISGFVTPRINGRDSGPS